MHYIVCTFVQIYALWKPGPCSTEGNIERPHMGLTPPQEWDKSRFPAGSKGPHVLHIVGDCQKQSNPRYISIYTDIISCFSFSSLCRACFRRPAEETSLVCVWWSCPSCPSCPLSYWLRHPSFHTSWHPSAKFEQLFWIQFNMIIEPVKTWLSPIDGESRFWPCFGLCCAGCRTPGHHWSALEI